MRKQMMTDEGKARAPRKSVRARAERPAEAAPPGGQGIAGLHRQIGNRAIQRLLAQRAGQEPAELDDETASRINNVRGSGQALDATVQEQMSDALGTDLSQVRVHTSPESDQLNRQLGAKAFTTGQDIFFRSDAYDTHSTGGQQLLAHELTHVVQQDAGAVHGGRGKLTVNAPGDAYEQEADATAAEVASQNAGAQAQRQEEEAQAQRQEEEELVQAQPLEEEEEEMQMQVQRQEEEEEEEEIQP